VKFSEVVRLLQRNGFELLREKRSIRYYAKTGVDELIHVDCHGSREVPTGTWEACPESGWFEGEGQEIT
jgi:predicted RNA binding protein YcfA (HicA-like mRNA interferase family)